MSSLAGEKALVTGATGFVGGHLARRLLQEGAKVTILVRPNSPALAGKAVAELKSLGAEVALGDVSDREAVFSAIKGQAYIFHCAALYREARFSDDLYFKVNLEGTKNVLDAAVASGVKRAVHTSTIGVHSHISNPPADETEPYHPTDVYQVSKVEAEKYARALFESGALRGAIIRPAMIWGEGDRRILKLFRGIARRRLPLIGSGKEWTHWIYVHDLVDAYIAAALRKEAVGQLYIIAGRRPVPMREVYRTIAGLAGVKLLPISVPAWPIQLLGSLVEAACRPFGWEPPLHRRRADFFIKNRAFDTTKALRDLAFCPRYDFEEEAQRVFTWYKENGWL
ncbi:MAG: NAD-dependent epimerase/dehydratase family protein [Oligoflexia bacterium]|nr:NAD-dependent epimerase/dehydratase family protein [Oligoflexia bacterium]